jgi:hypothetical protein
MSVAQNLGYAVVQIAHNFGAVAATGGSLIALALPDPNVRKRLAKIVVSGWLVQALSGAAFGATSYYFYHKFPDIEGTAQDALFIKMACVTLGLMLLVVYLVRGSNWTARTANATWGISAAFAVTALSAAAVLRWFS